MLHKAVLGLTLALAMGTAAGAQERIRLAIQPLGENLPSFVAY